MATVLQENALREMVEDGRNKGKALIRAGYSKNTAKAPTKVTESKGFKEIKEPIVKQLEKELQRAINALKIKNIDQVAYEKIVDSIDKLTKNIQLLGGKPTEIINDYSQMSDEELIRKTRSGSGTCQEGIGEKTS